MSLHNPFVFGVQGDALPLAAPPALRPQGEPASELQRAMAQATYARFCAKTRLSQVANPCEQGRLPDGTPYRIDVLGPQAVMRIWPQATAIMGTGNSGVVFDKNSGGRIWLLTNTASAAGESTAQWGFRDITDSQKLNAAGLAKLRGERPDVLRIPGDWKYSYRAKGLGRYAHPNTYEADLVGSLGKLSFVTQAGKAIFVDIGRGGTYIQQYVTTQKIEVMPPPEFGGEPPVSKIVRTQYSSQLLLQGAIGAQELPLPGRQYFTCSERGEYLAVAVLRDTGEVKSRLEAPYDGPDKTPDDKRYWASASAWPFLEPSRSSNGFIKLITYLNNTASVPETYKVEEILAQKYKVIEDRYWLVQTIPIGYVDKPSVPKVVTTSNGQVYYSRRYGLRVEDQAWRPRNLITSAELISDEDPKDNLWRLQSVDSDIFTVTLKKYSGSRSILLEGVDSAGNLRTYVEESTYDYLQKFSSPATWEILTSAWVGKGHIPQVGDPIMADAELKNLYQSTFRTDIEAIERIHRKYMDGLELDVFLVSIEAVNEGDYLRDLVNGGGSNHLYKSGSTTTYRSRVEKRNVLLRDPLLGVTVYVETIVTLNHQSSESYDSSREGEKQDYTPSAELPVHTTKGWIIYRDQRVSWTISTDLKSIYETTGYANIGRAISRNGNVIHGDGGFYFARSEPIWPMAIDTFESNVDFVSDTDVPLVQVYSSYENMGLTATHAKCPETGAMVVRLAGRVFLIDKAAGVRDARGVLDWPPGLDQLDFYTF